METIQPRFVPSLIEMRNPSCIHHCKRIPTLNQGNPLSFVCIVVPLFLHVDTIFLQPLRTRVMLSAPITSASMAGEESSKHWSHEGYARAGDGDVGLELAPHHDLPDGEGWIVYCPVECIFRGNANNGDDADSEWDRSVSNVCSKMDLCTYMTPHPKRTESTILFRRGICSFQIRGSGRRMTSASVTTFSTPVARYAALPSPHVKSVIVMSQLTASGRQRSSSSRMTATASRTASTMLPYAPIWNGLSFDFCVGLPFTAKMRM